MKHPVNGARLGATVLAVGLTLVLAGCSTSPDGPDDVLTAMQTRQQAEQVADAAAKASASATAAAATAAAATVKCSPAAEASYPPLASLPDRGAAGSLLAEIQGRGYLVVGVSGDTRLLGARNSLEKGVLEGLDIDLAKALGQAILGSGEKVRFKVITGGERFSQVNKGVKGGGVDIVARAVSMTCGRWQDRLKDPSKGSLFSAGYFRSQQRLLVRNDLGVTQISQLKAPANKVCAPSGSTSLANLAKVRNVTPVVAEIHSDCLALWQEGRVDAITGDDAILAGFAAQDRRATVVGSSLDATSYGFAIGNGHEDFVQYVNAVMATPAFRSAWSAAYQRWLAAPLQSQPQAFPAPDYSRPLGR